MRTRSSAGLPKRSRIGGKTSTPGPAITFGCGRPPVPARSGSIPVVNPGSLGFAQRCRSEAPTGRTDTALHVPVILRGWLCVVRSGEIGGSLVRVSRSRAMPVGDRRSMST